MYDVSKDKYNTLSPKWTYLLFNKLDSNPDLIMVVALKLINKIDHHLDPIKFHKMYSFHNKFRLNIKSPSKTLILDHKNINHQPKN